MPREVRRRRAGDESGLAELARDEVLGARAADADREVEALIDEIDDAVGKLDVELDARVEREEPDDRRRDMARAERHQGREPDRAARNDRRLRRLLFRFLQVLK